MDLREKFEKWATEYSGFEGGNVNSDYWFCGIEYGGDFNFQFIEDLQIVENPESEELQKIDDELIPCWIEGLDHKYQYMQKVAKVISCQKDGCIENWRDHRTNLFTKSGDIFKMNLFPINFAKDIDKLWVGDYVTRLGFNTKREYQEWCRNNRFPRLRELVIEYRPKVLICTSVGKKEFYKAAFLEEDSTYKAVDIFNHTYYYAKREDTGTVVIVTPFFGWGGITKDTEYVALSDLITKLINSSIQNVYP